MADTAVRPTANTTVSRRATRGPTAGAPADGRATRAESTRSAATVSRRATRARRTIVADCGPVSHITARRSATVERACVRARAGPASRPAMHRRATRTGPTASATTDRRATRSSSTVLAATVIRRASGPRFSHTSAREDTRPFSSRNARLAAVHRSPQVMIAERHVLVVTLHGSESNMMLVLCNQLVGAWPRVQAAFATVEAHTVHRDVVDHRPVVDVGDMSRTQVGNRPVVVERLTAPIAALKANTTIPVTVVDTTVETYVRAPVTGMPQI